MAGRLLRANTLHSFEAAAAETRGEPTVKIGTQVVKLVSIEDWWREQTLLKQDAMAFLKRAIQRIADRRTIMLFLIEYDRKLGEIVTLQTFDDVAVREAEAARLDRELELNRRETEREIVILQAENEQGLRKTHRRYFESLEDLAKVS